MGKEHQRERGNVYTLALRVLSMPPCNVLHTISKVVDRYIKQYQLIQDGNHNNNYYTNTSHRIIIVTHNM